MASFSKEVLKYSPIRGDDEDCDSSSAEHRFSHRSSRPDIPRSYIVLAGVLLLVLNTGSFFVGGLVGLNSQSLDLDKQCSRHISKYSPVLNDVDIKWDYVDFNGSFLQQDIYRKAASPEVDAAWEALGVDYRPGVIPQEEGPKSGLGQRHVQRSEKYGGGYFVNVEGMHHLHCLNLVRKSLYFNVEYYKGLGTHAFTNDENILQLHISHCLDTVRQVLMCNVDTAVLGQIWFNPENPTAFPDFNTQHKCKNFGAVREWAEKLQAPMPDKVPFDYLKKADPRFILPGTP